MFATYINYLEELIQKRDFLTFALLAIGILMAMLFIRFLFNRIMAYFNKDKKQALPPTFTEENISSLNNEPIDLESETPTTATHPEVEECFSDANKVPKHIKENLTPKVITVQQINITDTIDNVNTDGNIDIDNDDLQPKIEVLDSDVEQIPQATEEHLPENTEIQEHTVVSENTVVLEQTENSVAPENTVVPELPEYVEPLTVEEVSNTPKNVITIEDIEELDLALDEL